MTHSTAAAGSLAQSVLAVSSTAAVCARRRRSSSVILDWILGHATSYRSPYAVLAWERGRWAPQRVNGAGTAGGPETVAPRSYARGHRGARRVHAHTHTHTTKGRRLCRTHHEVPDPERRVHAHFPRVCGGCAAHGAGGLLTHGVGKPQRHARGSAVQRDTQGGARVVWRPPKQRRQGWRHVGPLLRDEVPGRLLHADGALVDV